MACSSPKSRKLLLRYSRAPTLNLNQHDRKLIGRSVVSLDRHKVHDAFVFEALGAIERRNLPPRFAKSVFRKQLGVSSCSMSLCARPSLLSCDRRSFCRGQSDRFHLYGLKLRAGFYNNLRPTTRMPYAPSILIVQIVHASCRSFQSFHPPTSHCGLSEFRKSESNHKTGAAAPSIVWTWAAKVERNLDLFLPQPSKRRLPVAVRNRQLRHHWRHRTPAQHRHGQE